MDVYIYRVFPKDKKKIRKENERVMTGIENEYG